MKVRPLHWYASHAIIQAEMLKRVNYLTSHQTNLIEMDDTTRTMVIKDACLDISPHIVASIDGWNDMYPEYKWTTVCQVNGKPFELYWYDIESI